MKAQKLCKHLSVIDQADPGLGSVTLNMCKLLQEAEDDERNAMLSLMMEDGAGPGGGITCFWDGLPCPCRYFW